MDRVQRLDKEIFNLVNQVRQDPKSIVSYLERMLANLDGEVLKREGKTNIRTNEGAKAVAEAIEYLQRAEKNLPQLRWSEELALCCKQHVEDIGPKGLMQHESSQGATVKERISSFGKIIQCYGENLSFACDEAQEVVAQLIVDDGVVERGHRENIFNREFRVFGCYSGAHRDFDHMSCLDFCGGLVKKGDSDPIEQQMEAYLKESVEVEMLADVRSWKQNTKVHVKGNVASKTVTRTCILKDGSEKVISKTLNKEFTY